jgi:hypothetical protein
MSPNLLKTEGDFFGISPGSLLKLHRDCDIINNRLKTGSIPLTPYGNSIETF